VVKSERFDYVYQGLDMLLISFRFQKPTPINGSFSCGLGFPPSYRHHLSFRVLSNQVVRCMWYSRLCSSSSKAYNTILRHASSTDIFLAGASPRPIHLSSPTQDAQSVSWSRGAERDDELNPAESRRRG